MSVFELKDKKATPGIVHVYSKQVKESSIPLIIDNGK